MQFVACDPATRYTGLAFFAGTQLAAVDLVRAASTDAMLHEVGLRLIAARPEFAIAEVPRVYKDGEADPNDLVRVSLIAGAVLGMAPRRKIVYPSEWKGQLDKKVVEKRVRHMLSPAELSLIPEHARHDVWEAVGIGLWYLKRPYKGASIL